MTAGRLTAWWLVCALTACTGTVTIEPDGEGDDDDTPPPAAADATPGTPTPDAAVSAPDADPGAATLSPQEQELHRLINEERVARGLQPVELRPDLNCAAARHSQDIGATGSCTHTGSDGSSPGTRVADCSGSGWTGEIVACGQGTPRAAVDAWIGSAGHNAIMFTPGQRFIGVAMHNNFWTAIFDG